MQRMCSKQAAIAATTAAAAAAAVAYWLGRRHSLTGKSSSTDLCSCGASLAGMTEADRRFHQQSRRHITNCRALRRGRIVVAENFSEYRRSIETVVAATDRVLEVGCGRGVTTALIARRCGHVLGVDLSAKVIAMARSRFPRLDFLEADASDVSALRARGPFDKIFVDVNGSRELQMLLPLLEALDAALAPEALVVKNAPLKRLLMRASLVDALPNAWSLALAPSGDGALLRREYKRCM
mmetsp:Transcript_29006/g.95409  ORF Transcript_29006/g.95409 Transcript_29006/m.95409 type:complete len:239 (+) Transcript_29006:72-788(+)